MPCPTQRDIDERHLTSIVHDQESLRRGGSTRTAVCTCGWRGPERASIELAADDALEHERSAFTLVRRSRTRSTM